MNAKEYRGVTFGSKFNIVRISRISLAIRIFGSTYCYMYILYDYFLLLLLEISITSYIPGMSVICDGSRYTHNAFATTCVQVPRTAQY
jgi:hypothetical protein